MKPIHQFHADVMLLAVMHIEMLRMLDIHPKQVMICEEDTGKPYPLLDLMLRIKDHISDEVMDEDEESRKAVAELLAKVGGAA